MNDSRSSVVSYLRLRFEDDGDGTGRLLGRVEAHGFAGEGHAYFDKRALADFATNIRAFPLRERIGIVDERLGIECEPIDNRGHVGVHVRLATDLFLRPLPASRHSVAIELLTTHGSLERFSRSLDLLLAGETDEVLLVED